MSFFSFFLSLSSISFIPPPPSRFRQMQRNCKNISLPLVKSTHSRSREREIPTTLDHVRSRRREREEREKETKGGRSLIMEGLRVWAYYFLFFFFDLLFFGFFRSLCHLFGRNYKRKGSFFGGCVSNLIY